VDDRWGAGTRRGAGPTDDVLRGPTGHSFTSRLERWVADARVDHEALRRARERWLQEVASQETTLAGVLVDLAERSAAVTVRTITGRRHHGVVRLIGVDFVALRLEVGTELLLALDAVEVVRTGPATAGALGDRTVATDLRLADTLADLATERAAVLVVPRGGDEAVAGELRSVGRDVAVVRIDGPGAGAAYVPLSAIAEVLLR
jgi:hypothetical protein